jgi:predicted site-specific integrase-resolvase
MYLKMKGRKLPEERLDLLQKWINDALSLQESMAQPSPEEMKIKAEQQSQQLKAQTDTQIQQARAQADIQIAQMKAEIDAQLENQRQQHEISFKMQENASKEQFDKWKAELDAATKIMVARIAANPGIDVAVIDAEEAAKNTIIETLSGQVQHHANLLSDMHNNVAAMHDHAMQTSADMTRRVEEAARAATAPKRIIRGPDGRAIGVETVQ